MKINIDELDNYELSDPVLDPACHEFTMSYIQEKEKAAQIAQLRNAKRSAAYPSIADQLDMLWHSMKSGEIQKSLKFYNMRKHVKDKYPKS